MSNATATRWGHLLDRTDARAAILVGLFALTITAALAIKTTALAAQPSAVPSGTSTSSQAAAGVAWAVAEALFAGVLLVSIAGWRHLPDAVQAAITAGLKVALPMVAGMWALITGNTAAKAAAIVGLITLGKLADELEVYWLANNLFALVLASYLAAFVGIALGPVILGVGMVGLAAYDHYFADRQPWMFSLAAWAIDRKLPLLVIIPPTLRYPWAQLADGVSAEDDEQSAVGIGMADLLLPAAFVVALFPAPSTGGAIAGTLGAAAYLSVKMGRGGGAGMPPLTAGALAGWAVVAIPGVLA